MSRIAAIALDAAELHFVERLIEQGELPNLSAIRERSARYELSSDSLYRTTLVWEAFLAGREDAGHQAGGGFAFEPDSYAVHPARALGTVPFYERASGIVPIVLDVPHLLPTGAGVRVCCWGGHILASARASVPRELLHEIDEQFGPHPAFSADHVYAWHRPEYLQRLGDDLIEGARRRIEVAGWLQERFRDWNLLIVVMSEAHSAGENFGHVLGEAHPLANIPIAALARERLIAVYRGLDDAVGRFAAMQPDDTALLVFALHGITINDADLPSQVLLPELLYRAQSGRSRLRDLDEEKWRRAGCPPVVPRPAETWKQHVDSRWRGARPGSSGLRRLGRRLLPHAVLEARRRQAERDHNVIFGESGIGADTPDRDRRGVDGSVPCWYREAWPGLRAFALPTFSDSRARINLQGRECHGVVSLEDYDRVCSEVEDLVRSCRDARTGRPAVEDLTLIRAGDPLDPEGPDADLVVRWFPGVDAVVHPEVGTIGPFPFRRTGGHTPHGFGWLSGPGIEPGERAGRPARDIPPTILSLLGQPVPPDVDGTPILFSSH
jgi:predicted AlkP superfamily phosphohydrolase/phosphomutase